MAHEGITCREYSDGLLERMESGALRTRTKKRPFKDSSIDTTRAALRRFNEQFGDERVAAVSRYEAKRWAETASAGTVAVAHTMFAHAVDDRLIGENPLTGEVHKGEGRSKLAPPTAAEYKAIVEGCDALGDHAVMFRAMFEFAAHMGMRPGELFALDWPDVDLEGSRVNVSRRLYRGRMDVPKSGEARTVFLTPPAREALKTILPREFKGPVFTTVMGKRYSQATLSNTWARVKIAAGVNHAFYLASKHHAVHWLVTVMGLAPRLVAAQMGWSPAERRRNAQGLRPRGRRPDRADRSRLRQRHAPCGLPPDSRAIAARK